MIDEYLVKEFIGYIISHTVSHDLFTAKCNHKKCLSMTFYEMFYSLGFSTN